MQTRYWNFKDDDSTAKLNRWLVGVIPAGLYRGFDFSPTPNMNLTLIHTTTGFTEVDDSEVQSAFTGMIKTRQGTIIKEDAQIVVGTVANGHATLNRYDIVVLTHEYTTTVGGSQAVYSIITGTPNASPLPPVVADAIRQIKIGELYIPATTTALNGAGVNYKRSIQPNFGGALNQTGDRVAITDADGKFAAGSYSTNQLYAKLAESALINDPYAAGDDFNTLTSPGFQYSDATASNSPVSGGTWFVKIATWGTTNGSRIQVATQLTGTDVGDMYFRTLTAPSSWTGWTKINAGLVLTKIVPIGDWNMLANNTVSVAHGLTLSKIRNVTGVLYNDAGTVAWQIPFVTLAGTSNFDDWLSIISIGSSNILIARSEGGTSTSQFKTTGFDQTSYNRGFLKIDYVL